MSLPARPPPFAFSQAIVAKVEKRKCGFVSQCLYQRCSALSQVIAAQAERRKGGVAKQCLRQRPPSALFQALAETESLGSGN